MENPCNECLVRACCTKEAHCEASFNYDNKRYEEQMTDMFRNLWRKNNERSTRRVR